MEIRNSHPSRSFIGQRISIMLDRTPAWPHIGLGDARITSLDEKTLKIDGVLNGLGLDGTFLYEASETLPGAVSLRLKIHSNCINVDVSKVIPVEELCAGNVCLHNGSTVRPLARINCRGGSVIPKGLELFDCHNDKELDSYKVYFDYDQMT